MYVCPNCQKVFENQISFCPDCGSEVGEWNPPKNDVPVDEPVYVEPVYEAPKAENPSQGKAITGLIFSIVGFVVSIVGAIYTLAVMAFGPIAFGCAMGFAIVCLPLTLVGFILSKGSRNEGNPSKACKVGKGLGLAGIIIVAASCLMGFIALI